MTAFRKLFIAVALVAVGLGVAAFLGEPVSTKPALNLPSTSSPLPVAAAPALHPLTSESVQLLPDSVATQGPPRALETPFLASPLTPVFAPPVAGEDSPLSTSIAVPKMTAVSRSNFAPQAQLRNEAPRPIGNEPRSPATIRRAPAVSPENVQTARADDAYKVTSNCSVPPLLPVGFASYGSSPSATTATYDAPAQVTNDNQVGPPTWPAVDEGEEPRTHVISDGDSLEKLAARYLDDPHRSAEIYELNRDQLSSPDLLPIGAELKIPDRTTRTSWDRQGRRTVMSNEGTVREAASGNLVPVRSSSPFDGVMPRAQLARPLPVQ